MKRRFYPLPATGATPFHLSAPPAGSPSLSAAVIRWRSAS
jgi:hypothetical protein